LNTKENLENYLREFRKFPKVIFFPSQGKFSKKKIIKFRKLP